MKKLYIPQYVNSDSVIMDISFLHMGQGFLLGHRPLQNTAVSLDKEQTDGAELNDNDVRESVTV